MIIKLEKRTEELQVRIDGIDGVFFRSGETTEGAIRGRATLGHRWSRWIGHWRLQATDIQIQADVAEMMVMPDDRLIIQASEGLYNGKRFTQNTAIAGAQAFFDEIEGIGIQTKKKGTSLIGVGVLVWIGADVTLSFAPSLYWEKAVNAWVAVSNVEELADELVVQVANALKLEPPAWDRTQPVWRLRFGAPPPLDG